MIQPDPGPFWDAHCHLADPRWDGSLDEVLIRSRAAGVGVWIQGGVDPADWSRQTQIRNQYGTSVVTSAGVHPWWVTDHSVPEISVACGALQAMRETCDSVGELGLDLGPRLLKRTGTQVPQIPALLARQQAAFEAQLRIARSWGKPWIFHIVQAHPEALAILRKELPDRACGLIHSFSASWEIGRQYLSLGLTLSVGGVITRPGYRQLKEAVRLIPSDQLVLETDSPDQAPQGWEGLNEPASLWQVARAVGALRNEAPELLMERSRDRLRKIFGR